MAILTAEQLAGLRQSFVATLDRAVDFSKPCINNATQAVENWFEGSKAAVSDEIDSATSPYVFSASEKKLLIAYWMLQKASREGA